jgi:pimeloyl-ACP methyl ester carboxylesterase
MARLQRPDGAQLAWEERGEGPLFVLVNQFFGGPELFTALLDDLARDHRLVTYDIRGIGASSREGPYDFETDARDLEALIEEVGPPALVMATADGINRAVRAAVARPDLITVVVSPAGNPVGRKAVEGTEGLAGSEAVLAALIEMMRTDYRGAMRTMFSTANPDWDEDRVRDRVASTVETLPQDVAVARMKEWIADDNMIEQSLALGDRLWLLDDGGNPWFPIEASRNTRQILPEAHVLEVEAGAITRPDITAGVVRRLTAQDQVLASEGREQAR